MMPGRLCARCSASALPTPLPLWPCPSKLASACDARPAVTKLHVLSSQRGNPRLPSCVSKANVRRKETGRGAGGRAGAGRSLAGRDSLRGVWYLRRFPQGRRILRWGWTRGTGAAEAALQEGEETSQGPQERLLSQAGVGAQSLAVSGHACAQPPPSPRLLTLTFSS